MEYKIKSFISAFCLAFGFSAITACSSGGGGGGGGGAAPAKKEEKEQTTGTIAVETEEKSEEEAAVQPPQAADSGLDLSGVETPPQKIQLKALAISTTASLVQGTTDLDKHKEQKFVWNPAQLPLEELNKIVCAFAKSGFHLYDNQGKFVSKSELESCFSDNTGSESGSQSVAKPVDVIVETAKAGDGEIGVKMWFTRSQEGSSANSSDMITWEPFQKLDMNYFVTAKVREIPNEDNPFGDFDLNWEMTAIIDGQGDSKPYQQGYVMTSKSEASNKTQLQYNQRNWMYNQQNCPTSAWATYNGFIFYHNTGGAGANGTVLPFDGFKDISTIMSENSSQVYFTDKAVLPAGSSNLSSASPAVYSSGSYNGISFNSTSTYNETVWVYAGDTLADVLQNHMWMGLSVGSGVDLTQNMPEGSFQLSGGSAGVAASATIHGVTFSVMNYFGSDADGLALVFDGAKTIEEVFKDFKDTHGYSLQHDYTYSSIVLPSGNVTLQNGVNQVAASATANTNNAPVTFSSSTTDGLKYNGFEIIFDGSETAQQALDRINPTVNYAFSITSGDSSHVPDAGKITLTGGAGPSWNVMADMREYVANAEMTLKDGKPHAGRAHTAENWAQNVYSGSCPVFNAWNPQPVSYGMAFHKLDAYPNQQEPTNIADKTAFPGRSVTKQFGDYVASGAANGFDSSAPRCEQIGGELASVWQWAIFDEQGNEIKYRTDFELFLEGSNSSWGDGWASPWGISFWTEVVSGDKAYIKNPDGSKKVFDVDVFNGSLMNDMWMNAMYDKSTGTEIFSCAQLCPSGDVTQAQLDDSYSPANFLYDQEYIFNYATKELYRDVDKNGSQDVLVKLESGAEGWFEFSLKRKSDSKDFRYSMSSWYSEVGLKQGSIYFTAPSKINFDTSWVYNNELHAYPGSKGFNKKHDGKSLANLIDGSEFSYEYGNLCCLTWEQKSGFIDEWGNKAYASVVTFKKGTELTVDASSKDPDGSGPIYDGMKIKIAPAFSELRPQTKEDCSSSLISDTEAIESSMTLPEPLADANARKIGTIIGARPSGQYPVLIKDGEKN